MTVDTVPNESQLQSKSPSDRKRQISGDVCGVHGPRKVVRTSETPSKQQAPEVANNGWGDLFKDRETFLEMHIC